MYIQEIFFSIQKKLNKLIYNLTRLFLFRREIQKVTFIFIGCHGSVLFWLWMHQPKHCLCLIIYRRFENYADIY